MRFTNSIVLMTTLTLVTATRVRHDRATLRASIARCPHQWQRQAYTDHRDFS